MVRTWILIGLLLGAQPIFCDANDPEPEQPDPVVEVSDAPVEGTCIEQLVFGVVVGGVWDFLFGGHPD